MPAALPRIIFVEPFFLRCETCRARLRVRDERFLGQIQACPKCGSMVHILAPAGWLAAEEATPESAPAEVAAEAAAPSLAARLASIVRQHAVAASTGAATIVIAGGLAAFLALRGGETEVAALPPVASGVEPVAVAEKPKSPPPSEPVVDVPQVEEVVDVATAPVEPSPEPQPVATAVPAPAPEVVAAVTPPVDEPTESRPVESQSEAPARALVLEPVDDKPVTTASDADSAQPAAPEPSPGVETAGDAPAANPPAAKTPERRTNIHDQLALPIDSIDLPTMPIGEFVNLMSTMTAVPIRLEAKVLGDVGLSTRSTVTVRGESTTAGKLLAQVLKEHQLTCVEHDGVLVVVKAKR